MDNGKQSNLLPFREEFDEWCELKCKQSLESVQARAHEIVDEVIRKQEQGQMHKVIDSKNTPRDIGQYMYQSMLAYCGLGVF